MPDTINIHERILTALKKIAMSTIPMRLVVNSTVGNAIMRRIDEVTFIRFPALTLSDDSEIDIDEFLLDAAALYVMAGLEKEKAPVYMAMYKEILEDNERRLVEVYLSAGSNEGTYNDASSKFV